MMKTAMIWGAAGAIGKALTAQLLENQWQVIAIVRDEKQMESQSTLTQSTLTIEADFTNTRSVQNAILSARSEVDQVSLWIYAGGDEILSTIELPSPEGRQQGLGAMLTGAFVTSDSTLPLLQEDTPLIFIGTGSSQQNLSDCPEYLWAKSALEAYIETLRVEERKRRIILVYPGVPDIPDWGKVPFHMAGEPAAPEEVAGHIMSAYHEGHKGVLDLSISSI
jgi:NAD(P)-dependent dehydrogenase (short-subunit alcohol dehydrogenase family)